MKTRDSQSSDVIIIGGGATGAGIARDCALRGLRVILVERHDIATGATGRNHGLLHSGARYAVTDAESARECISENQILKRIARHCVEPTNGLFITLPEDDLSFQATFIRACEEAGISAEAIDPQQARIIEPTVNPALIGAVKVPDGTVDPFRLTAANMLDAKEHGAVILTAHEVTGLIREGATVCGVRVRNHLTGETQALHAPVVVNAAGISIAYGFSKFIMGSVSDRSNPRVFLPAGLILAAAVMLFMGFVPWATSSIAVMFVLLFLCGWFQGMGWPPCGRTMVHWWSQKGQNLNHRVRIPAQPDKA